MKLDYRTISLSLNERTAKAERIPATISSETPVTRYYGQEILDHSTDSIDLSRAENGLSLLWAHDHREVIGRVENIRIVGRQLKGELRPGTTARANEVWEDIRAGIVVDLSIGYAIQKFEEDQDGNRRATRWTVYEVSAVSVPADPSAGIGRSISSEEVNMDHVTKTQQDAPDQTRQQVNTEIQKLVERSSLGEGFANKLISRNLSIDEVRAEVLEALAVRDEETRTDTARSTHYEVGGYQQANSLRAMGEALACRYAPIAPSEQARQFTNMRLVDMARSLLETNGLSTRMMSETKIIERALHTTSDFPELLTGVGDRILRQAYESAPAGVKSIAAESSARDFRAKTKLQLGEAPSLLKVNEAGEFTRGSMAEAKESYSVETYGRIFGLSRQALVNDDLSAFADMLVRFGRSAAEFEAGFLVDLLASNPTMSDSTVLFHSDHGNKATSGGAISVDTLGAARKAMRLQKGLDGKTPINATPRYLVIPAALEAAAEKVLASIYPSTTGEVNPFSGTLTLVVDPRLDAHSSDAWYLAADPASIDTIEYAYLEGVSGPQIMMREGFDVDGLEIKCRLDFGGGILDWRGLYYNAGK